MNLEKVKSDAFIKEAYLAFLKGAVSKAPALLNKVNPGIKRAIPGLKKLPGNKGAYSKWNLDSSMEIPSGGTSLVKSQSRAIIKSNSQVDDLLEENPIASKVKSWFSDNFSKRQLVGAGILGGAGVTTSGIASNHRGINTHGL